MVLLDIVSWTTLFASCCFQHNGRNKMALLFRHLPLPSVCTVKRKARNEKALFFSYDIIVHCNVQQGGRSMMTSN